MTDYTVYLLTNKRNGKVYVGQTTMDLPRRWTCHVANKDRTPLVHAIRKHGPGAFSVERIAHAFPGPLALDAAERFWIGVHGCIAPRGYNLTDGGQSGTTQSDATCAKKSAFHLQRYLDPAQRARQGNMARVFWARAEVKQKASASHAAYWTPEARAAHSARQRVAQAYRIKDLQDAGNAARRTPIIATKDGRELAFSSQREAARALGVHESAISQCLNGRARHKRARGYTFKKGT